MQGGLKRSIEMMTMEQEEYYERQTAEMVAGGEICGLLGLYLCRRLLTCSVAP
jgi:hypothetical protein